MSGIGRPESFERTIEMCGAEIAGRLRFPDHHRFDDRDCATIREEAARLSAPAVTTEKDRCRLSEAEAEEAGLHTLGIRLAMEDRGRLFPSLFSRLREGGRIEPQV